VTLTTVTTLFMIIFRNCDVVVTQIANYSEKTAAILKNKGHNLSLDRLSVQGLRSDDWSFWSIRRESARI